MEGVRIHPTAIVSPMAQLGVNVEIGPFTVINDDVEIGDNTIIGTSNYIDSGSRIGKNCNIFHHTIIGTDPQDIKYNGEKTYVSIGDNNKIREFVTINRGTTESYMTKVGNDNLILEYCHIAHDCQVGNNTIFSNTAQLAGHVKVGDWVIIGGFGKVHQFTKIGKHAFIGGDTKIVKDVVPYAIVSGADPKYDGVNLVGLRRRGFTNDQIFEISNFYKSLFHSGLNVSDFIKKYITENANIPELIVEIIEFINTSERGIYLA